MGAVSILNRALHNSRKFVLRPGKSFNVDLNENEQMAIFESSFCLFKYLALGIKEVLSRQTDWTLGVIV